MEKNEASEGASHLVRLTATLTSSYVAHNHVPANDLTDLIRTLHAALASVTGTGAPREEARPAVSIKKSVTDSYLICLEDGKKLTMLKRYLRTHYDMSPEQYRAKWGLPIDYPMAAPNYARLRSAFAKKIGLGRKPTTTRRGRKRTKE